MRRLPLRSPPRMRGKARANSAFGNDAGITPAYAGKSPPAKRKNPAIWDHPRVCGEKIPSSLNWPMFLGSPPRVRGKADSANLHQPKPGITPAYAGKSTGLCEHSRQEQDHPRVCGEKSAASIWAICARGSPPRMRGKDPRFIDDDTAGGITPACAGKRPVSPIWWTPCQDHPRVCGEKSFHSLDESALPGSPPRVRGKAPAGFADFRQGGITPACAGKSVQVSTNDSITWDHPRVCGEKARSSSPLYFLPGSPPRMRGKVLLKVSSATVWGITPAYAGKSSG